MTDHKTTTNEHPSYPVVYSDVAADALYRLRKREPTIHSDARSMIGLVAERPLAIGYPLDGEWEGTRAVHFARDRYRLIWEVDDEPQRVVILRLGKRGAQGTSIYDLPRPGA